MINLQITGDELDLMMTGMKMSTIATEKYMSLNGEDSLDYGTMLVYKEMIDLLEKLEKEHY